MEDVREECTMQNIVTEIETIFCDEEYGFEVYALIKGDEKTLKRVAFYEKSKNNQDNFKDKIQKTIGACGHFFRPLCLYSFYNLEGLVLRVLI